MEMCMRRVSFLLGAATVATLLLSGCSVGKGVGAASGEVFEYGCSKNGDWCDSGDGGVCGPKAYDLEPSFFAGEPIDDLRQYAEGSGNLIMNNRLTIRLQRSGKRIEQNDVLTFDIASSYEVARCVRGHVFKDGTKDWDEANCYRAGDNAPGRVRLQWDSPAHASLSLKATCVAANNLTVNVVASAVAAPVPLNYSATPNPTVTDGSWLSWVEFEQFGTAAQYERAPVDRDPVSGKFRIELGNRIYAPTFLVTLEDDEVVTAARNNLPKPSPRIGGWLGGDPTKGRFDFDIQRGQGAQFFP
jgi:hypothetical protein